MERRDSSPPNFGQRSKANVVTSNSTGQADTFVLSAQIPETPGNSGILIHDDFDPPIPHIPVALISQAFKGFGEKETPTFMDSGASDTMFLSKDSFLQSH